MENVSKGIRLQTLHTPVAIVLEKPILLPSDISSSDEEFHTFLKWKPINYIDYLMNLGSPPKLQISDKIIKNQWTHFLICKNGV